METEDSKIVYLDKISTIYFPIQLSKNHLVGPQKPPLFKLTTLVYVFSAPSCTLYASKLKALYGILCFVSVTVIVAKFVRIMQQWLCTD